MTRLYQIDTRSQVTLKEPKALSNAYWPKGPTKKVTSKNSAKGTETSSQAAPIVDVIGKQFSDTAATLQNKTMQHLKRIPPSPITTINKHLSDPTSSKGLQSDPPIPPSAPIGTSSNEAGSTPHPPSDRLPISS